MKHYIAFAGIDGQTPDHEQAFPTRRLAAEGLGERFDLTERQTKRLLQGRFIRLDVLDHGVEYAELQECDCDEPWGHSDTDTAADWEGQCSS